MGITLVLVCVGFWFWVVGGGVVCWVGCGCWGGCWGLAVYAFKDSVITLVCGVVVWGVCLVFGGGGYVRSV
jgi:hypothetical protein